MILGQPIFVFDIETITDLKTGQHLYQLDLAPDAALAALQKIRRQESGSDFPRLPLHEIVCISGFWLDENGLKLFSWTQDDYSEQQILEKFASIFERRKPVLVSFNGTYFDMPVIMQRCLYHGVSAKNLFDHGESNSHKRFDNYQNRYQLRHTDLVDVLANFNLRNFQKLDDVAQMLGYPGKRGVTDYQVMDQVENKQWIEISKHCEGDVLNTWLVYLRWLLVRGFIDHTQHQYWIKETIHYLKQQPQHDDFLKLWKTASKHTIFTQYDFAE